MPSEATSGWDLLAGRVGDLGAPAAVGLVLPVLALLSLVPSATRIPVVACWVVAAVTGIVGVPLAVTSVGLAGGDGQQPGLGIVLLVLQGAWLTAAVLGGLSLHHLGDQARPVQAASTGGNWAPWCWAILRSCARLSGSCIPPCRRRGGTFCAGTGRGLWWCWTCRCFMRKTL